jgi:acetoin utilization deacetylase AcuC-like enzyme
MENAIQGKLIMKIFYSPIHVMHHPPFEILDGGERSHSFEVPARVENIISHLRQKPWAEIFAPAQFGLDPILAVHDEGYLEFLESAFRLWTAGDNNYEHVALMPATFPPGGKRRIPQSVLGKAGYYMMDLSAPIGAETYQAALQSAYCSLSGAEALLSGEHISFSLCRPPGHHAGRANCGGYCYLNNSSIAANWLSRCSRVAVLDIDYHAGNGTQEIFYERDDVLSISIHADPEIEYPYFAGYQDEIGIGRGEGFHLNIPLPYGTTDEGYIEALQTALAKIRSFDPGFLVISAGMDIYQDDPLGKFKVTREGIRQIGSAIEELRLPTLVVMEGGYDLGSIGENFLVLLENLTNSH